MKEITGINEANIDKLILDIYDYSENINQILSKIKKEIELAELQLSDKAKDAAKRKMIQQEENTKKIKIRLQNLIETLLKVKDGTIDFSAEVKKILIDDADKLLVEYKPYEKEEK